MTGGPEPGGVAGYAARFTQGWVDYFEHRVGSRPEDSHWREFRSALGRRTNNVCWYCERECCLDAESGGRAPTVDHFRPRNRFPALSYAWSNWVYSCRRCNENKDDGWPEFGYVNPCADLVAERPERYLAYDAGTGEMVPRSGLTGDARLRALRTIADLRLNDVDVRLYRHDHTRRFMHDLQELPTGDRPGLRGFLHQSVR